MDQELIHMELPTEKELNERRMNLIEYKETLYQLERRTTKKIEKIEEEEKVINAILDFKTKNPEKQDD